MLQEEYVVVEGQGLHLRIPLLHSYERTLHVLYGYRQNAFEQDLAYLAVTQAKHKTFPAPARDNEVAFHVAETPSFVDFAWSCVDHALVLDALLCHSTASATCKYLFAMTFNLPTICRINVLPYSLRGHIGKMSLLPFDSLRDVLRRLIVKEVLFNECSQLLV